MARGRDGFEPVPVLMPRRRDGLEPRLTGARECLEFFGRRVEMIARWLEDEAEGLFQYCVDGETECSVGLVELRLRRMPDGCRNLDATMMEFVECSSQQTLRALAEELRRAIARSGFRPEPRGLIEVADEIEATYLWWNAVSSGKRALSDGPPLRWVRREMSERR